MIQFKVRNSIPGIFMNPIYVRSAGVILGWVLKCKHTQYYRLGTHVQYSCPEVSRQSLSLSMSLSQSELNGSSSSSSSPLSSSTSGSSLS